MEIETLVAVEVEEIPFSDFDYTAEELEEIREEYVDYQLEIEWLRHGGWQ